MTPSELAAFVETGGIMQRWLIVSPTGSTATQSLTIGGFGWLVGVWWSAYFQSKTDADTAVAQLRIGTAAFEASTLSNDRPQLISEIRFASIVTTFGNYNSTMNGFHPLGMPLPRGSVLSLIAAVNTGTIQASCGLAIMPEE